MVLTMRVERVKIGASQLDIALRIGISSSRLSLIERGLVEPRADESQRLEKLFGVSAARLFREVGPPRDPVRPAA